MGIFKKYLVEELGFVDNSLPTNDIANRIEFTPQVSVLRNLIYDELNQMNDDEIFAFGYVLYYEFFEEDLETQEEDLDFDLDDITDMISKLGHEYYGDILDLLSEDDEDDDFDWDSIEIDDDSEPVTEAAARIMKRKNFNRKKRKFFKKTKAQLRKGLSARRKLNRINKPKRKKYFRVNKKRLSLYKKSRSTAVKKGRHIVKVRRGA